LIAVLSTVTSICYYYAAWYSGCEYGDRAAWCKSYTLDQCKQEPNIRNTCCFTCNGKRKNIDTSLCLTSL